MSAKVCTTTGLNTAECGNETNVCTGGVCVDCVTASASCHDNGGGCITTGPNAGVCNTTNTCVTQYATTDECEVGDYCHDDYENQGSLSCVFECEQDH